MGQKSQIKRGAVLSYFNMLITISTGFILSPLMKNTWGADNMGCYILIGSMIGYISLLDFGLGDCIVRYVAKFRAQENKKARDNFINMCFTLYLVIAVVVAVVGVLLFFTYHNFLDEGKYTPEQFALMDKMFLIVLLNLVVSFVFQVFPGVLGAYEKFIFIRRVELIRNIVRPIIVLLLLHYNYDAVSVVIVDACSNIFYYACVIVYALKVLNIRVCMKGIDYSIIRELFNYSFFVFLTYVVNQLNWKIDHLILGMNNGGEQITISSTGTQFANYFIQISTTLATLFLPRVTNLVVKNAGKGPLTDIMIRVGRIQFLILGLVFTGFTIIGKQFMVTWMGPGFIDSYYIGLMMMVALFVPEIQTVGLNILFAKSMHKFRACMLLGIAVLNVAVSIPLANNYGAIGAAIGTALSLLIGNGLILNIYYNNAVGVDIKRFFKETCHGLLPVMLISILLSSITFLVPQNGWFSVFVRGVIVTVIYFGMQWIFGMNRYEKNLIIQLIEKFTKKLPHLEGREGD